MINEIFFAALKEVMKISVENKVFFILTGTANLSLQGIELNHRDTDLLVRFKDLEKARFAFRQFKPSEITPIEVGGKIVYWETTFNLGGVLFAFFSDKSNAYDNAYSRKEFILLRKNSLDIPCFSLETEARLYSETGRQKRAELILNFLKTKS